MHTNWTFRSAQAFWNAGHNNPDADHDQIASAEDYLLGAMPRTDAEAAMMLRVIHAQGGDGRTDGLDVEALGRIIGYLSAAADHASVPQALSA